MKILFSILFIIFFINYIKSDTVVINCDKCIGNSKCYYNDVWNPSALTTDDLVFVTTDPLSIPTINLPSRILEFNSLNVSNIALVIVTNGKFIVKNSVYVGPKASLLMDGPNACSAGSIYVDGVFTSSSRSGPLTVANELKINQNGSLNVGNVMNVGSLNVVNGSGPVVVSTGVLSISNDSSISSSMILYKGSSLKVLNGTTNFNNIPSCGASALIINNANIKFGQSENLQLECLFNLTSGSNLFFQGSNVSISNIVPGSSTNLYLSENSDVSLVNISLNSNINLYYISIDSNSYLSFDNSIINYQNITALSNSNFNLVNLQNYTIGSSLSIEGNLNLINSSINLGSNVTLSACINIDSQSMINLLSNTTLTLIGKSIISNVINVNGKLNINNANVTFNNGLNSSETSSIAITNSYIEINGDIVDLSGKLSINGDGLGQFNINSKNNKFKNNINVQANNSPININSNSIVSLGSDSTFNSPVYCLGNSILNIIMNSNLQFNAGLNSESGSILTLQNSQFTLKSNSNILGEVQLNNGTISTSGNTRFTNKITSDPVNINNNLNVNNGSCLIDTTNTVDISGIINVMKNSILRINNAKTTCSNGVNNFGKIIINSLLNTTKSFSQTVVDAELELVKGSNIISKSLNLQSGKINGHGNLTSNNCQCGGLINSNVITVNGNLNLLKSAIVVIDIIDVSNFSKILVNGNVNLNGEIDVNLNNIQSIKKSTIFEIISCSGPNSSINGSIALSNSEDSQSFKGEKSKSGTSYNLIYQSNSGSTSGNNSSTGNNNHSGDGHASSSNKLASSIILLFISFLFALLI